MATQKFAYIPPIGNDGRRLEGGFNTDNIAVLEPINDTQTPSLVYPDGDGSPLQVGSLLPVIPTITGNQPKLLMYLGNSTFTQVDGTLSSPSTLPLTNVTPGTWTFNYGRVTKITDTTSLLEASFTAISTNTGTVLTSIPAAYLPRNLTVEQSFPAATYLVGGTPTNAIVPAVISATAPNNLSIPVAIAAGTTVYISYYYSI